MDVPTSFEEGQGVIQDASGVILEPLLKFYEDKRSQVGGTRHSISSNFDAQINYGVFQEKTKPDIDQTPAPQTPRSPP